MTKKFFERTLNWTKEEEKEMMFDSLYITYRIHIDSYFIEKRNKITAGIFFYSLSY